LSVLQSILSGGMKMTTLQGRITAFVGWVATESAREDEIREQSERIREKISAKAREDELAVQSTPNSGSFAKRTGLRRHLKGASVVDGQDVDLPFVVTSRDNDALQNLLKKFDGYAAAAYPDTKREPTKSSIQLSFTGTGLSYDLVPMLATGRQDRQILLRADGERRETSVQEHISFVRSRTQSSDAQAGRVKFNECVRLWKWWKEFKQDASSILPEMPSIIIELLAGRAFDELGVQDTYAHTMAAWTSWAANCVDGRKPVVFGGHKADDHAQWSVIDPVSQDNNIVAKWGGLQLTEFSDWFSGARDQWQRAIRCDLLDDDTGALDVMNNILGTPFQHHCGD